MKKRRYFKRNVLLEYFCRFVNDDFRFDIFFMFNSFLCRERCRKSRSPQNRMQGNSGYYPHGTATSVCILTIVHFPYSFRIKQAERQRVLCASLENQCRMKQRCVKMRAHQEKKLFLCTECNCSIYFNPTILRNRELENYRDKLVASNSMACPLPYERQF
jgi:hypothetical protein